MHPGVIKFWLVASLLAVLTACTTVAVPDLPSVPPLRPSSSPVARKPLKLEAPDLALDAAPLSEMPVDDKYLLTGEAARELERGQASWYGPRFHGRLTASGERYDRYALTAAHKTLPFGTVVRVRSLLAPGREVEVRINDRGPFAPGRVIDLSQAAAEVLGLRALGITEVSLKVPESTALRMELPEPVQKVRRSTRRSPPVKRR
ncbi:MAG TPA: septal ring lytic transglycosylase RlpA family protein [Polaromonas sp.]|nr:septal ring lytic transglycosylase RlpA family protein [Polaromonas sp.]